jgi:hypothetical protein
MSNSGEIIAKRFGADQFEQLVNDFDDRDIKMKKD